MRKLISFIFFATLSLVACSTNNGNEGSMPHDDSTVPSYQGMTVSYLSDNNLRKLNRNDDDVEIDEHDEHDEDIETDITDIVTIDVQTDDEVKYYVKPNETFVIQVHLSNPKDYEIQSFTLNGKKYANYMFKDGSTMELLLLETTAPSTSGYIEYTIDAIKYIDGTEIKDVDMSKGDKSIKAGVAYTQAPTASITTYSVNTTYVEMGINVLDPQNLIGTNQLSIYLSDGEQAIASKDLKVGDNFLKFDNLVMSKTYQYGVVTAFDFVDGKDMHSEWILTNTFTTLGAYKISNVVASKTSVSFDVDRTGEVGTIDSISLYDATTNELVERGNSSIRSFNNLLSNHTYNLYVDFSYQVNGQTINDWVVSKDITTVAKVAPTLTFDSSSSDKTSVSYSVSTEDSDGILNVTKVELLKNGEAIKDNGTTLAGSFTGLLSNNQYSVKVSYTYDLNDGQGAIANSITKNITTVAKVAPTLTFDNIKQTVSTLEGKIVLTDNESVIQKYDIELYNGDILIDSTTNTDSFEFNGLNCWINEYEIRVSIKYNLNDGKNDNLIEGIEYVLPLLDYALLNNNTYSVLGFHSHLVEELIIPESYNNKPVSMIGDNAFANTNIKTCVLPDSIITIGENAFKNCAALESININSKIRTIKNGAFDGCSKIVEYISSNIVSDETFNTGKILILSNDIMIKKDAALTINKGVIILGNGNDIQNFGTLIVNGENNNEVVIYNCDLLSKNSGDNSYNTFNLNHLSLKGGSFSKPTGNSQHSSILIDYCEFYDSTNYTYIWYPEFCSIKNSYFENWQVISIGADIDVTIMYNTFYKCGSNLYDEPYQSVISCWAAYSTPITIRYNNFIDPYRFALSLELSSSKMDAQYNYFGTIDELEIKKMLWDGDDDFDIPNCIDYSNWLTEKCRFWKR